MPQVQEVQKSKAYVPEPSENLLKENLKVLGKEMAGLLLQHDPKPVAVDDDIHVQGLKNPQYLVLVGFSGKRLLNAIAKHKKKTTYTLIIEPDVGRFRAVCERELITDVVTSHTTDILLGIPPEHMTPHLYKIFTASDEKSGARASRALHPEVIFDPFVYPHKDGKPQEEAIQINDAIRAASRQAFLAMGCASDSYIRWEQFIRNVPTIKKSHKISSLFDKFKGRPAIVVGGGPSVEEFIDAARKYDLPNRCLIIACDAVLPRLLRHEIRPHIVTRCERKLTKILEGVTSADTDGIYFATYPWVDPHYADLFPGRVLMCFRDNGVCLWSGFKPGSVNGGVSSANAAVELAFLFGCKDIVLTGVDLAFVDGKSHVSGTRVEFDINKSKPKWTKVETNDGEKADTIPVWERCRREYETAIVKHAGRGATVHNVSKKGAKISGTNVTDWETLAGHFKTEHNYIAEIKASIKPIDQAEVDAFEKCRQEGLDYLKRFKNAYDELNSNLSDGMMIAEREEAKLIRTAVTSTDPIEFWQQVRSMENGLVKVYGDVEKQHSAFANEFYRTRLFSLTLLDICQLDYFTTENKTGALVNTLPTEHERLKLYVKHQWALSVIFGYYADRLIQDLETMEPDRQSEAEKEINQTKVQVIA